MFPRDKLIQFYVSVFDSKISGHHVLAATSPPSFFTSSLTSFERDLEQ